MQEVPIVAVQVIAIVAGIKSTEAMHGVMVQAAEMPMIAKAGTRTVKAVYAGSDASAAKPADVTDAATDVSPAEASDSTDAAHPADVPTATKSADMTTAAEAAAHTAPVAATTAAAAAARLCLRSQQARRQQGRRQNGYHLSHHFSPFSCGMVRASKKSARHQRFRSAEDKLAAGFTH
jgi:hypothetical protein